MEQEPKLRPRRLVILRQDVIGDSLRALAESRELIQRIDSILENSAWIGPPSTRRQRPESPESGFGASQASQSGRSGE